MNKKNKKGWVSGILGTVAVIIGVIVYAILAALINNLMSGLNLAGGAACALYPLTLTGITVAFVLYEAIFITWQIKLGRPDGDEKTKMEKIFKIVFILCVSLSLIFAMFSANTYTRLDDNSIKKVCFVEYKEYGWTEHNSVLRYTLSCDENGMLSYTVIMKDGESFEILGQVNSCSQEFLQKHKNLYGYAAYLSEQFDSSEFIIEGKVTGVENMQKHHKNNKDVWPYLERIILLNTDAALNTDEAETETQNK